MKKIAKQFIVNFLTLWLLAFMFPSITFDDSFINLLVAALTFTALRVLVTPVLKLLYMPVNLLTFGFLSFIPDTITIVILTFVSHYQIRPVTIPRLEYDTLKLPAFHLGWVSSFLLITWSLSILRKLLKWGIK